MPVRPAFLYALGSLAVSTPCAAQEAADDRWLGPDKSLHAFVVGWIASAGYAACIELDWAPAEALDAWTEGERLSFKDLTADAVGIAALVALAAAADR